MLLRGLWLASLCLTLLISFVCIVLIHTYTIDPSDYFGGAQHRPRLEIINPDNGQVLDNGDLAIKIRLDGYNVPSQFHGSTICVGLTNSVDHFTEKCFEQVPDLTFTASGLSPGHHYSLRVILFERENAIAVSVRHFKVAGIRGVLLDAPEQVITIQTAVQVAMEYQAKGLEAQAEQIYRSILSEAPGHADALHLLGVVVYQQGNAAAAVPYIEAALHANASYEGFHNSLGVCYRTLGRVVEAELQFKLALALKPSYLSAVYNLGLTYEQQRKYTDAVEQFRMITEMSGAEEVPSLSEQVRTESKVRECDLLQAQKLYLEARRCLEEGLRLFPSHHVLNNELGNVLSQLGLLEQAYVQYQIAAQHGHSLAALNIAHILELQGYCEESRVTFEQVLVNAVEKGLPAYHIKVRLATTTPRVVPPTADIDALRRSIDANISKLLESSAVDIDNSPPLHFGFSTGYHLFFLRSFAADATAAGATGAGATAAGATGAGSTAAADAGAGKAMEYSNVYLKSKLHRLYAGMCPALLQGFYLERDAGVAGSANSKLHIEKSVSGNHSFTDGVDGLPTFKSRSDTTNSDASSSRNDALVPTGISTTSGISGSSSSSSSGDDSAANSDFQQDVDKRDRRSDTPLSESVSISNNNNITQLAAATSADRVSSTMQASVAGAAAATAAAMMTAATTAELAALEQTVTAAELFTESTSNNRRSATAGQDSTTSSSSSNSTSSSSRTNGDSGDSGSRMGSKVRIGFVSRFFNAHPVGLLTLGIVSTLRHANRDREDTAASSDKLKFELIVFVVDGGESTSQYDAVQRRLMDTAHVAYILPAHHMGACAQAVRSAEVDLLIYPEIGLDPLTYFLSFARLAPVQATWLAHPDTSGNPAIDYFITSSSSKSSSESSSIGIDRVSAGVSTSAVSRDDEIYFSEKLYRMEGFGTLFVDIYQPLLQQQETQPRTALLNRAKFIESVSGGPGQAVIPKSAHLYCIAHSIVKLHPLFDEVLLRILQQDRLAYILIIDSTSYRPSWQQLIIKRLAAAASAASTATASTAATASLGASASRSQTVFFTAEDIQDRFIFHTPEMHASQAARIMQLAHVVLEPFPVSGDLQASLEALAIGVPVVTLPSRSHVGGQFALMLYQLLGYGYQDEFPLNEENDVISSSSSSSSSSRSSDHTEQQQDQQQQDQQPQYSPLVVRSIADYVQTALKLTHQPKLRSFHSEQILLRRHRLFQPNFFDAPQQNATASTSTTPSATTDPTATATATSPTSTTVIDASKLRRQHRMAAKVVQQWSSFGREVLIQGAENIRKNPLANFPLDPDLPKLEFPP